MKNIRNYIIGGVTSYQYPLILGEVQETNQLAALIAAMRNFNLAKAGWMLRMIDGRPHIALPWESGGNRSVAGAIRKV